MLHKNDCWNKDVPGKKVAGLVGIGMLQTGKLCVAAIVPFVLRPALPGDSALNVSFMNNVGEFAGVDSGDRANSHAFTFSGGSLRFVGALPRTTNSVPNDINDSGLVVGDAYAAETGTRGSSITNLQGFLFARGTMTAVGPANSHAMGINKAGHVVGYYSKDGKERSFIYIDGTVKEIASGENANSTVARKINSSDDVTGVTHTGNDRIRAFRFSNGKFAELGTLSSAPNDMSEGIDINDAGAIIGVSRTGASDSHAFVVRDGAMTDLGTLGGRNSRPHKINSAGVIVGEADASDPWPSTTVLARAFLYTNGKMIDLNTVLSDDDAATYRLQVALSINDKGVILVGGVDVRTNTYRQYILVPTSGNAGRWRPSGLQDNERRAPRLEHAIRYEVANAF
jgi:probable HAF family extracellular repeat protein